LEKEELGFILVHYGTIMVEPLSLIIWEGPSSSPISTPQRPKVPLTYISYLKPSFEKLELSTKVPKKLEVLAPLSGELGIESYIGNRYHTEIFDKFILVYYRKRSMNVILDKKYFFPEKSLEQQLIPKVPEKLLLAMPQDVYTPYELIARKETLQGINNGYVKSLNIFNEKEYPIVCEYAKKYLNEKDWNSSSPIIKSKTYKWLSQIIILEMYRDAKRLEANAKELGPSLYVSLFTELKIWAHNLLDLSIKQHLLQRSVVITREKYAGFDTEYVPRDLGKNTLLSAQLSMCGGIRIEVPVTREFVFEGVHTLTDEIYMKEPPKLVSESMRKRINELIQESNNITYKMSNFIGKLRSIASHETKVKGFINFLLPASKIISKFVVPEEGEELRISMRTLAHGINNIIPLNAVTTALMKYLNNEVSAFKVTHFEETPPQTIVWSNELENREVKNAVKEKGKAVLANGIKITIKDLIYLIGHYNAADLSMLSDWNDVSYRNVDILKKSYVSLNKALAIDGLNVKIRDTVLLASAAAGTLEAIAKSHNLPKIEIASHYKADMRKLWEEDRKLFEEYAMRDSLATLTHALFINDFAFKLGMKNLPLTLGSISATYIKNKWENDSYKGYQIDPNYPLGDVRKTLIPRGITTLGKTGEALGLFIGSFRGGRNECFAHGVDKETRWYDYDLASCYSSIMSMCGDPDYLDEKHFEEGPTGALAEIMCNVKDPDYSKLEYIKPYKDYNYKEGYSAMRVKFKFPDNVAYPCIPVNIDKNITVYPREGEGLVTGLEYLAAKKLMELCASRIEQLEGWVRRRKELEIDLLAVSYEISSISKAIFGSLLKIASIASPFAAPSEEERSSSEGEFLPRTSGPSSLPPKSLPSLGTSVPSGTEVPLGTLGKISSEEEIKSDFVDELHLNKNVGIPEGMEKGGDPVDPIPNPRTPIVKKVEKPIITKHYSRNILLEERRRAGENIPRSRSYIEYNTKLKNIPILIRYDPHLSQNLNNAKLMRHDPSFAQGFIISKFGKGNVGKRSYSTTAPSSSSKGFIKILYGFYIPFKKEGYKPFFEVINELQANRRKHPKKSAMERIFKDLGNMLYGKTVTGISNKRTYDARHDIMMPTNSHMLLTNPIIGGWITGYVRSLIAELLNTTHLLDGKIVSATTDGFVTNIPDLENKILKLHESLNYKDSLIQDYRDIRFKLSKNAEALEVKTNVRGILQWTTRGQLSYDHTSSSLNNYKIEIAAMTGFQKQHFNQNERLDLVLSALQGNNKILYLQKRLTGALDSYASKKQVSMISHLSQFRTNFDSKRNLILDKTAMLFSDPYNTKDEYTIYKTLLKSFYSGIYSANFTNKAGFVSSLSIIKETINYFVYLFLSLKQYQNPSDFYPILNVLNDLKILFPKLFKGIVFDTIIAKALLNKGEIANRIGSYENNRFLSTLILASLKSRLPELVPSYLAKFGHLIDDFTSINRCCDLFDDMILKASGYIQKVKSRKKKKRRIKIS